MTCSGRWANRVRKRTVIRSSRPFAKRVNPYFEEPNFRAYSQASELLFMNAVLLGPAR